jgi:deoxycytidylate deaminase
MILQIADVSLPRSTCTKPNNGLVLITKHNILSLSPHNFSDQALLQVKNLNCCLLKLALVVKKLPGDVSAMILSFDGKARRGE